MEEAFDPVTIVVSEHELDDAAHREVWAHDRDPEVGLGQVVDIVVVIQTEEIN